MTGIVAYGAYVPRLRLDRAAVFKAHSWFNPGLRGLAKGERSMANWDEDVVTMAVEAARDCLPAAERGRIASIVLASTTAPFADRQNAGIVKEALNLADEVATQDTGGSQKAGTGALIQALQAVRGGAGEILCIGSEHAKAKPASESELINGDGAAAMLLGTANPIATFLGSHSVSADFVDHFRADDRHFDYGWESRWIRDEGYAAIAGRALKDAMAKFGVAGADIAHLIVPIPVKGVPESLAKKAGIPATAVQNNLSSNLGYTGAAEPLVLLAHALRVAQPGEKIVVLGFGQGCDVLLFEVTAQILKHHHPVGVQGWLARRKPETNYFKFLCFNDLLDIERGMRAEFEQKQPLTALYRNRKAVMGLVGGKDTVTGTVQFPKSPISVAATNAVVGTQEDYPLADVPAKILTYTADSLTYHPDPPCYYGMVEFEGGGRILAEFADADAESVEVGKSVRMVFRVKAVDANRGFKKYFWKAVPAA
ncbi:MAG: hypothetical protein RIS35_2838 [Pseudomonadota bacterium]